MFFVRFIDIYSIIVLVSVIISWIQLPSDNPIAKLTDTFTEPLLKPIRRVLPDMGGLDFSPMLLLIALQFLKRLLIGGF